MPEVLGCILGRVDTPKVQNLDHHDHHHPSSRFRLINVLAYLARINFAEVVALSLADLCRSVLIEGARKSPLAFLINSNVYAANSTCLSVRLAEEMPTSGRSKPCRIPTQSLLHHANDRSS